MFEERLIKEVRKHPCIYDRNHRTFKNKIVKEKAWATISKAIDTSIPQCQMRWKTLRERFVRDYGKILSGNGDSPPRWKFTEAMSFMSEYISQKTINRSFEEVFEYVTTESESKDFSSSCLEEEPCTTESMQSSTSHVEESYARASNTPAPKKRKEDTFSEAHKELSKMIETVGCILEKKIVASESRNDAFYKYLETLLAQVDKKTQDRIKVDVINLVSQRVLEQ